MKELEIKKKRHGCLTAWLITGIVVHAFLALIYLFIDNDIILSSLPGNYGGVWVVMLFKILGLLNILFFVLMLYWKKMGVILYAISTLIVFYINFTSGANDFYTILFSLLGLVVLAVLLILEEEETGKKAWDEMDLF